MSLYRLRPIVVAILIAGLCAGTGAGAAEAQIVREHGATNLRGFHGDGTRIRRTFEADPEAKALFKQLLVAGGLAGLEDRIHILASADTENAVAVIENVAGEEKRSIVYNAVYMQRLRAKTGDYWSMLAVLAHEISHHLRLHLIIPERNHEFELEADYQAGFILRRMGATLDQAQQAFQTFPVQESPSHPRRADRLQAVTLGWTAGAGSTAGAPPPAMPSASQAPSPASAARAFVSAAGLRFEITQIALGRTSNSISLAVTVRNETSRPIEAFVVGRPNGLAGQGGEYGTSSVSSFAQCSNDVRHCVDYVMRRLGRIQPTQIGAGKSAVISLKMVGRGTRTQECPSINLALTLALKPVGGSEDWRSTSVMVPGTC